MLLFFKIPKSLEIQPVNIVFQDINKMGRMLNAH